MRRRYCQRCSEPQRLADDQTPHPCVKCGGVNFDLLPVRHSGPYQLTANDRIFLRVQGIDPEDEHDDGA